METATTTYDEILDRVIESGYLPTDDDHFGGIADKTVEYMSARGWYAVRNNGDSLSFARWSDDEGNEIMITTLSGCVQTEARFSTDRFGHRLFLDALAMLP